MGEPLGDHAGYRMAGSLLGFALSGLVCGKRSLAPSFTFEVF